MSDNDTKKYRSGGLDKPLNLSPAEKERLRGLLDDEFESWKEGQKAPKPVSPEDAEKFRKDIKNKRINFAEGGAAGFPDLTGDGKVTRKDILKGRGVEGFKYGGKVAKMESGGAVCRGMGSALRGGKFVGVR